VVWSGGVWCGVVSCGVVGVVLCCGHDERKSGAGISHLDIFFFCGCHAAAQDCEAARGPNLSTRVSGGVRYLYWHVSSNLIYLPSFLPVGSQFVP